MIYRRAELASLAIEVGRCMSEKRFNHTVSTAKCAFYLAALCNVKNVDIIVAAALHHDITKEMDISEQLSMIEEDGIELTREDIETQPALHSFSAQCLIKRKFPKYYNPQIISAVSKHTLGAFDMSIIDKIIFLADFIEPSRKYERSVELRHKTFSTLSPHQYASNIENLNKRCLDLIDITLESLKERNMKINSRIFLAKKGLLSKSL